MDFRHRNQWILSQLGGVVKAVFAVINRGPHSDHVLAGLTNFEPIKTWVFHTRTPPNGWLAPFPKWLNPVPSINLQASVLAHCCGVVLVNTQVLLLELPLSYFLHCTSLVLVASEVLFALWNLFCLFFASIKRPMPLLPKYIVQLHFFGLRSLALMTGLAEFHPMDWLARKIAGNHSFQVSTDK